MSEGQDRLVGGRYRLIAPVGRGGMGAVWRARDGVLDRDVAIKEIFVPIGLPEEERAVVVQRAFREARAAARLRHRGVVTIYDVIEDGSPWIVMELLSARSLDQVIRSEGPLPEPRVAQIGLAVLDALGAAHAAGIVHRDIKPANVLLADDGQVVLTDFGIALLHGEATLTRSGVLLGTLAYMAPERLGGAAATTAGDLWSLGATLYTAVEGVPPYNRPEPAAVVGAILTADPDPMRHAAALQLVIEGLLRREPAQRPTSEQTTRLLQQVAGPAAAAQNRALASPPGQEEPPRDEQSAAAAPTTSPAPAAGPSDEQPLHSAKRHPSGDPGPQTQTAPLTRPAAPTDRQAPAKARSHRRRIALTALTVGVLVAAGSGGSSATRQVTTTPGRAASPAEVSFGDTSTTSPPPGASTPPGFTWYGSAAGKFKIAVPQGWRLETRGLSGGFIRFYYQTDAVLEVIPSRRPDDDPRAATQCLAELRRVGFVSTSRAGDTHVTEDCEGHLGGGERHTQDVKRWVAARNGRQYKLWGYKTWWQPPEWTQRRDIVAAMDTFTTTR